MAKKFVFEEGMKRIEEIVRLLENGDASLDDSLKLFTEATDLIRRCGQALDSAEQTLRQLHATDSDAEPEELPFEVES